MLSERDYPITIEVEKLLLSLPTVDEVLNYRVPEALDDRMQYLVAQNQVGALSEDERHELDAFLRFDAFLKLLYLRALKKA